MSSFTSEIVYTARGVDASTGQVIKLADAMAKLERRGPALQQSARATATSINALSTASGAAMQRLAGTNASIDPVRAGLAALATQYIATGRSAASLTDTLADGTREASVARQAHNALAMGMVTAGLVAAGYAGTLVTVGDQYTSLQGKIRVYADSAAELATVETALFASAREARTRIEPMVALYARLAPSFLEMGKSQADAIKLTELTSKALTAQGATTREVEASTLQFAQAMASGVLRGDEFRSMMEASPGLMRMIAKGFEDTGGKIGVPVGALRKMAEEGQLTAEKVIAAIYRMEGQIETSFEKAPKTASQAFDVLNNSMMRAVGMQMTGSGTQEALANALMDVADSAEEVVRTLTLAAQAAVVYGSALAVNQIGLMIAKHVELARVAAATAAAVQAQAAAQRASATMGGIAAGAATAQAGAMNALSAATTGTFTRLTNFTTGTRLASAGIVQLGAAARGTSAGMTQLSQTSSLAAGGIARTTASATAANIAFGGFNATTRATPLAFNAATVSAGQYSIAASTVTARTAMMAAAQRTAGVALAGFRAVAGSFITFMGGPWVAGITVAIGLLWAMHQATSEAAIANRAQQETMERFAPVVSAYNDAMDLATRATGRLKGEALETVAALRAQASEMYRIARLEVTNARVAVATAESIVRNPDSISSGESGWAVLAANNRLTEARAAQAEAEKQLRQMELIVEELPRGNYAIRAPTIERSGSGGSGTSTNTRTRIPPAERQAVQAMRQTAQAAREVADAETTANGRLAASLNAVEQTRRAALAAADLQYRDNPAAKAEAIAAIETKAQADREQAQNRYRNAMRRAAEEDERNAARDERARARHQVRLERETALLDQLRADKTAAEAQARIDDEGTLQAALANIQAEADADIARIGLRISNAGREADAIKLIRERAAAEAEAARDAHAKRLAEIDERIARDVRANTEATFAQLQRVYEGRAEDAKNAFEQALKDGDATGARQAAQAWADATTRIVSIQQARLGSQIQSLREEEAAELASLRRRGLSQEEFEERRLAIANIYRVKRENAEAQSAEEIARIQREAAERAADAAKQAAERRQSEIREANSEWYEASTQATDRLKRGVLDRDWDNIGRDIAKMFLEALYDQLIHDPLNAMIREYLDSIFSKEGSQGGGGSILGGLWDLVTGGGFGGGTGGGAHTPNYGTYAKGGAFTNSIVNRATPFRYGSGRLGIMGEAGPEAIVPLVSGPNGYGVRATGPYGTTTLPLQRAADGYLGVAFARGAAFARGGAFGPYASGPGMGAYWANAGEGMARAVQLSVTYAPQIDARGADPEAIERLQSALAEERANLPQLIRREVSEALYNNEIA